MDNSGERKTHHKTPPQKRFWTPPLVIHFPSPPVCPRPVSGAKKESPNPKKIARTVPKNFLNNSRALPNKTRDLRQIAPESSPKSSVKSLSQKFFGVPFLSLTVIFFRRNGLAASQVLPVFRRNQCYSLGPAKTCKLGLSWGSAREP